MVTESIHGQWTSRWAFILAATGSAVGLGNIWKFPYITGENGGGAFVLVYLLCIAAIGIPIMMAEVMLGRRGRQSPINTMAALAKEAGTSKFWKYLGGMGMLTGFLILSYYSVIAGWSLGYTFRSMSGMFEGQTADGISNLFGEFLADPEKLLAWHTIFMVMTMLVVARGVKNGLEKAVRFLMPALFLVLLILLGYSATTGSFAEGASFLFTPDFSKLTADGVLVAMGHAFFTLSLGMGAIMIYGSYLPKDTSIAKTTMTIALADTGVALLAGLVIFPIVFANGLEPGSGPGLVFVSLPIAFGQMPGGLVFGTLFFVLLVFAAWTSAISLIEPVVAWLVEKRGMTRLYASVVSGFATWVLGAATILSFNHWAFEFEFLGLVKQNGIFDFLDVLTANILLPLGGLLTALFVGWVMKRKHVQEEMALKSVLWYQLWLFLVRFIAPMGVIIVFLNAFDLIDI